MARPDSASLAVLTLVGAALVGCGRVGYELATGNGAGISLGTGGGNERDSDAPAAGGSATHDAGSSGTGGTANDGSAAGTGGVMGGTGGAVGAGGATGAGGALATGGAIGGGGAAATGGANGTGGGAATGGTIGTDGSVATGGATGTGGATMDGSVDGCAPTNGSVEICDGIDNDCGGGIDEGAVCGSQCTGATYDGHAYAFCSSPLPFADAAAECLAKSMRLARIDGAQENQFLAGIAFAATGTNNNTNIWPWFGAHSVATPVQWVFMDGTVFWSGRNNGSAVGGLYSNWASASPGDTTGTSCATMSHAGALTWVDRGCSTSQPYLCEAF